jgi:hypothetical protein
MVAMINLSKTRIDFANEVWWCVGASVGRSEEGWEEGRGRVSDRKVVGGPEG